MKLSEFTTLVQDGEVRDAQILEGDQQVRGHLNDGSEYVVTYPAEYADELTAMLDEAGVPTEVRAQKPNEIVGLLYYVLPILLLAGLFLWMMNRAQGGGGRVMQFGRSRHKTVAKDQPKTSFDDVAGVEEAIEELQGGQGVPGEPGQVPVDGRQDPPRRPVVRPPGNGEDAARARRRGRGGCAVLLDLRVGLRRDVRRGRGGARPRPLRAGQGQLAGDRVRGRDRRRRPASRRRARWGSRRAGADAEPAPRRDGRVRPAVHGDPDGRDQPPRHPRPGAPAPGEVRPADRGRPARPRRPQGDPPRARKGQAARSRGGPRHPRAPDAGVHGRRSRQRDQ